MKCGVIRLFAIAVALLAVLSGCKGQLKEAEWRASNPAHGYLECGNANGVLDEDGFVNSEVLEVCVRAAPVSRYEPDEGRGCYSIAVFDDARVEFVPRAPSETFPASVVERILDDLAVGNSDRDKDPRESFARAWRAFVASETLDNLRYDGEGKASGTNGYTKGCIVRWIPEFAKHYRDARTPSIAQEIAARAHWFDCLSREHVEESCDEKLKLLARRYPRYASFVHSSWAKDADGRSARACDLGKVLEVQAREGIRQDEDDAQFVKRRSDAEAELERWRNVESGDVGPALLTYVINKTWATHPECRPVVMRALVKAVPRLRAEWEKARAEKSIATAREAEEAKVLAAKLEKERADASAKAEADRVKAERQAVLKRRFEPIVRDCERSWQSTHAKCTELPGLSDEERAQCQTLCADTAQAARTKFLDDARASCIETWADTGVPSVCNLEVPDGAKPDPQWVKSEAASCSAECRKQGPEARRERVLAQQRAAREEAERAREAAAERARNPGPSAGTRFCRSQCKSQGMSCLEQNCGCDNPNVSCPLTACSAACLRQKNACDARCGD